MLNFIDTLLAEPLKDLYSGLKKESTLHKQVKYDVKRYIKDLANELNEFTIHRSNQIKFLSRLFIEPRLLEIIVSQKYYKDYSSGNQLIDAIPMYQMRKFSEENYNYMSMYELIKKYQKLIILGLPGSGKTTILRKIVIDIASDIGINAIPVYMPLRNSSLKSTSILHFIQKQFEIYGIESSELLIKRLLEKGQLILLFDGIDEISLKDRQRVIDEINDISSGYPNNKFIATSRLSSYKGELSKFQEAEVCEFSISNSIQFIENWGLTHSKQMDLINKIQKYPQIEEIATSPLLLSLICLVYDRDLEILTRRSTLYKRCIECLMRDWDAQRNFRRESKFSKLDELKRFSILSQLGFQLHRDKKIYFKYSSIMDYLSPTIQRFGLIKEDIPAVIEEVIDHYGLICEVNKGVYAFTHLSFQEFFAANYIAENRLFLRNDLTMFIDPFWEEVLILCSSILPDATEYLNLILGLNSPDSENLFIAGLCLSVDPVIDLEMKRKIIHQILDRYHNGKIPYEHEKALYVLCRIDDTFVGNELLKSLGTTKIYLQEQIKKGKPNIKN